jgi:transcriptional regulator with XRE-family HTH domain
MCCDCLDDNVHNARRVSKADQTVGRNMLKRRLKLGFTLSKVATMVGCSECQLELIEAGEERVSAKIFYKIARLYRCSMGSFFIDDQEG